LGLSVERERPFSKAEGKESNEYAFFERDFELEQIATNSRALVRARISIFLIFFLCSLCRRVVVGLRRSDALGRRFLDKAIARGENKKANLFFGFIKRKNRSSQAVASFRAVWTGEREI